MSKFHEGQTVILVDRRGPQETKITRVGRKYVYTKRYGNEVAFHADTGTEKCNLGFPEHIYTPQGWADKTRRDDVLKNLRECGIEWKFGGYERRYSTDALQQILDILTSTTPTEEDPR